MQLTLVPTAPSQTDNTALLLAPRNATCTITTIRIYSTRPAISVILLRNAAHGACITRNRSHESINALGQIQAIPAPKIRH
jgi:hypothetical protein